jgi:hypothetical protein
MQPNRLTQDDGAEGHWAGHQCNTGIGSAQKENRAGSRCRREPHITIHREHGRQAILTQELDHHLKGRLRVEILMHLSEEEAGRASIYKIADFDEMVSLPRWRGGVSADCDHIFKIHLHFLQ